MVIRAAVLTVSDSAARGEREDVSGPAVCVYLKSLGWSVWEQRIVPDEAERIAEILTRWCDGGQIQLIVTTGGTGVALRDVTPEATRKVMERDVPGLPELMRAKGLEKTPFSVLSRGVAGTRGRTLILNVPGSPKGAVESAAAVAHLIPHVVELLAGKTEHAE